MSHRTVSQLLVRQIGSLFEVSSGRPGSPTASFSSGSPAARVQSTSQPSPRLKVARHGPMVLGVCRQFLGDRHHAEDVFQAVFLVLARRARSIRDPDLLGNWLYGVALRTARKVRGRLARRRKTEEEGAVGRYRRSISRCSRPSE